MVDELEWLEQWYAAQCVGDWAEDRGVKIDTLDNPGWLLKVDLRGTDLEGRMADALVHRSGEPPSASNGNLGGEVWMDCLRVLLPAMSGQPAVSTENCRSG